MKFNKILIQKLGPNGEVIHEYSLGCLPKQEGQEDIKNYLESFLKNDLQDLLIQKLDNESTHPINFTFLILLKNDSSVPGLEKYLDIEERLSFLEARMRSISHQIRGD